MWEFEYEMTDFGVKGILPSGEEREFATVDDYREAYEDEENDIIDGLAEIYDEVLDYPEDWPMYA